MNSGDFKEKLQKHNDKFSNCFKEELREVFVVAENENKISCTKDFISVGELGLKIFNPGQQVGFLAIDNCYFENLKDFAGERCDCLLFSSKELLFVELKLDVTSKRRITENLKEGRKQLANTISYYHNNFEYNFISFKRFAIIVIPKPFYPRSQSRLSKIRKEFYDNNYKVDYIEKSEFSFAK
ncbi:MAG: hypothetical protein K8S16_13105 [Bacteroidales bacterium]|nr:hypothetical protein [Bacteroidales bacterium]